MLGSPAGQLRTARGSIAISTLPGGVYIITVVGHLEDAHAHFWIERVDPALNRGSADACCDWWDMTGYESSARKLLTEWALRRRTTTRSACFLVRPGIVAMGVSVASMALTITGLPVDSTSDRTRFDALVRERATRAKLAT